MNDTIQVITDTIPVAQKAIEYVTTLPQVIHSIAPLLYFMGSIVILAIIYFIWDARQKNKRN